MLMLSGVDGDCRKMNFKKAVLGRHGTENCRDFEDFLSKQSKQPDEQHWL